MQISLTKQAQCSRWSWLASSRSKDWPFGFGMEAKADVGVGPLLRCFMLPRPKLTERITLRIPNELLADLTAAASRRSISINEVALCCFENDLARIGTYRLDYYTEFRPLLALRQGDDGGQSAILRNIGRHAGKLSDNG